ncbi:hypothetical protein ACTHGU_21010 [Chitinophagaceae bacterium MMS25-I14]
MLTQDNNQARDNVPFMNTLTSVVNKVVKQGYVDNFKITDRGMFSLSAERYFRPEQVKVINFYRFEGQSDPSDNAILYVIETSDGHKGTLIDAYGAYADPGIHKFMNLVEDMQKKMKGPEEA